MVAVGAALGANQAAVLLDGDAVAATAAEVQAGVDAYAEVVHTALKTNDAAYNTAFGNLSAADQQLINTAVSAAVGALVAGTVDQDANSGLIVNDSAVSTTYDEVADAVVETVLSAAGAATITASAIETVGTDGNANTNDDVYAGTEAIALYGDADATAIANAAADQAFDAAMIAAYNAVVASAEAIAAADNPSLVAAIEANNVATLTIGADNIDIDGGAATSGNDVFIFSEAGGSLTVGTAATAAAPGNVLFGAGDDSVVILGEYTDVQFVTIGSAAAQAALGTTAVGDAAVLEAFVYQNAATGDTVISFEENAFDGSTTTGAAMTTLTLTDVTWANVTTEVVDGFTVLSETAVIA